MNNFFTLLVFSNLFGGKVRKALIIIHEPCQYHRWSFKPVIPISTNKKNVSLEKVETFLKTLKQIFDSKFHWKDQKFSMTIISWNTNLSPDDIHTNKEPVNVDEIPSTASLYVCDVGGTVREEKILDAISKAFATPEQVNFFESNPFLKEESFVGMDEEKIRSEAIAVVGVLM